AAPRVLDVAAAGPDTSPGAASVVGARARAADADH
ncbi:hypothetical protein B1M_23700, partial [Burkholderia sp. TJI49]